jgi:hypothetical protein
LAVALALLLSACAADDTSEADAVQCESLDDEAAPANAGVVVVVRNARADPVRLVEGPWPWGGDDRLNPVRVSAYFPSAGNDDPVAPVGIWPGHNCAGTCQDFQRGECLCHGAPTMVAPVFLAPGGEYRAQWPGVVRIPAANPAHCLPSPEEQEEIGSCPTECERIVTAPPGQYLVEVTASGTECTEANCDCTPNTDGWCRLTTETLPINDSAFAILDDPQTGEITITFE